MINQEMFFAKVFLIVNVYFLLFLIQIQCAPIENTTLSSAKQNLWNESLSVYEISGEHRLNNVTEDADALSTTTAMSESSPADDTTETFPHPLLAMIFISKEQSNSFLHHRSRRSIVKVKNTGPNPYDQMSNSLYRNFKYIIPERMEWWPVYRGHDAFNDCFLKDNACKWNEVYWWYGQGYKKSPPWTYELASVVYWYQQCIRGSSYEQSVNCPRPCLSNPCSGSYMVKCVETGSGVTKNYYCVCQTGWNYNSGTRKCDDISVCNTPSSTCVAGNTERCVEGTGLSHTCQCKAQWMGTTCKDPYDACIGFNNPCGGNGVCVPHKGQQTWTCNCDEGWGDDPDHQGRDCNKRDDPCEKLMCRNGGECIRSSSLTSAYCHCPALYQGSLCEERIPQWNPWEQWSDCDITCGTGGKQTRLRSCDHAGASYCGGGVNNDQQACSGPICLVNGEWGAWSKMTACSHNCDGGKYLRARNCEYSNADPDTYGDPCKGELLSYEDCNVFSCPEDVKRKTMVDIESLARSILAETGIAEGDWGAWNSWTSCSETCGDGFQQRGRTCLNSLGTCEGQSEEFQDCYDTSCEEENEYLPWSTWSVWSVCGPMTSLCTRTRHCPYGSNDPTFDKACPGSNTDEAPCMYNSCTGEAPADLVDVANVMGGDAAMQVQMGNMHAAGLPPNSYLHGAAPSFVAAPMPVAPIAMAPIAMAPVVQAPMAPMAQAPMAQPGVGYPGMPPVPQHPAYEQETISAAGALAGIVVLLCCCCCCCCLKKKCSKGEGATSAGGYKTKSRAVNDY